MMATFSKQPKIIARSVLEACRAILFLGALLLVPLGCNNYNPDTNSKKDDKPDFVDSDAESFSDGDDASSDDDDGVEKPSESSPNKDDPDGTADGYLEALELEGEMLQKIREVTRKKGLRLAQVNLLEKQLADLRKAGKVSKAKLKKIKAEVKRQIEFILTWEGSHTDTIKCKSCNKERGVDRAMLFHMDNNIFGSGSWSLCDDYGNTLPNSPVYPSLAAIIDARSTRTHFVHTCAYCYRDRDIAREEGKYESAKKEYENFKQEYQQAARRANRSIGKEDRIKNKLEKQASKIAEYKAAIDAYGEAAKTMESFRAEAIVDYEVIPEGFFRRYEETEEY